MAQYERDNSNSRKTEADRDYLRAVENRPHQTTNTKARAWWSRTPASEAPREPASSSNEGIASSESPAAYAKRMAKINKTGNPNAGKGIGWFGKALLGIGVGVAVGAAILNSEEPTAQSSDDDRE